jgi:hypothetical protein
LIFRINGGNDAPDRSSNPPRLLTASARPRAGSALSRAEPGGTTYMRDGAYDFAETVVIEGT